MAAGKRVAVNYMSFCAMNRSHLLICVGFVFLIVGMVLTVEVLVWFAPVFDGDSMLPDGIAVLSSLSVWDYLQVCLCGGLLSSGLVTLLIGATQSRKEKQRKDRKARR